jgi:hypothetical protein
VAATDDGDAVVADDRQSALLRERLQAIFASGDPRLARLSAADTSVRLVVTDAPEASVTMLLDRRPPALASAEEPAEITLELTLDQASQLISGALAAPAALLAGEIPYRGPVRKYLAVHPVLRGLLSDLASGRSRG